LFVGKNAGSNGAYVLSGGNFSASAVAYVGYGGTGTFLQTATLLNHASSAFTVTGNGNTSLTGLMRITGATGGALTFARTGGTHTVAAGSSLQVDTGATLSLAGAASVFPASTSAITLTNAGALVVSAGSNVVGSLTGGGTTSVTGGLLSTAVLRQSGLLISGGSLAVRPAATPNSPASTTVISSLSITGGGTLDLGNDSFVIDYAPGVSPLASIRNYHFFGRSGGTWNGAGGITSTSAAIDPDLTMGFAYVEASDLLGLSGVATATWGGVTVDATSLLVKYTYAGDANLNGKVDPDDLILLDRGFARGGSAWISGDFDYDGAVTSADYLLIDKSLARQSTPLSPTYLTQREAQFGSDYVATLVAAVPEPTPVLGVGLAGAILAHRRRSTRRPQLPHSN
jgi:hypothetical protein